MGPADREKEIPGSTNMIAVCMISNAEDSKSVLHTEFVYISIQAKHTC